MKKYLLLLTVISVCVGCRSGKTYADIINEFRNEQGANYVSIPKALLKAGTAFIPKGDGANVARSINSIRILSLDECPQSVRNRFMKRVAAANDDGYEPFLQTNDKNEQTRVLLRSDDKYVREILIATASDANSEIIQVTGEILLEDVQHIIDETINQMKAM